MLSDAYLRRLYGPLGFVFACQSQANASAHTQPVPVGHVLILLNCRQMHPRVTNQKHAPRLR